MADEMRVKHVRGLGAVLLIYLCIGAAIFQATEKDTEENSRRRIMQRLDEFAAHHNNCVDNTALIQLIEDLSKISPAGYLNNAAKPVHWDYAGAFTFAVTVVTTIGYGHVYPQSILGRGICVFYALFGIPLTMLVLAGIGEQMNKLAQKLVDFDICTEYPVAKKVLNIFVVVTSGLLLLFVLPSFVFWKIEGWTILEGLYYCFITLSTIGFGDYIAGHSTHFDNETLRSLYRVAVYLWILMGLAYITLVIQFISKLLISKAGKVQREANKRIGSQRLDISDSGRKRRALQKDGKTLTTNGSNKSNNSSVFTIEETDSEATSSTEHHHRHRKLEESFSLESVKSDVHLIRMSSKKFTDLQRTASVLADSVK